MNRHLLRVKLHPFGCVICPYGLSLVVCYQRCKMTTNDAGAACQ